MRNVVSIEIVTFSAPTLPVNESINESIPLLFDRYDSDSIERRESRSAGRKRLNFVLHYAMDSARTNVGCSDENLRHATVLKVGGSLFDDVNLFDRISALCKLLGSRILIISGGGGAANAVREWDRVLQIGEVASHAIAIHAMGLGARLIAHGVSNCALVGSVDECVSAWCAGHIAVAEPQPFIDDLHREQNEDESRAISASWQFTSDSIAAWIGRRIDARRIVFGKSLDLVDAQACNDAVDDCLPKMVDLPPLLWCNMRDDLLTLSPFEF